MALAVSVLSVSAALWQSITPPPEARHDPAMVESIDFGLICTVDYDGTIPAPDTTLGSIDIVKDTPRIIWHGHTVPLVQGITFGVVARGAETAGATSATMIVTHPPFRGHDTTRESYETNIAAGQFTSDLFSFDFPYELVAGRWSFEMQAEGRVLYHVDFDVVPPEQAPQINMLCRKDGLTS